MTQAQTAKKATKQKAAPKQARVVKKPTATGRAAAPKTTNPHLAVLGSGKIAGHITGLVSSNPRPKFPILETQRNVDDRKRKALYMLRDGYGTKRFSAAFLDAGIMKVLMSAGLVAPHGGEEIRLDNGSKALTIGDGMEFSVTAAGQKYGKA